MWVGVNLACGPLSAGATIERKDSSLSITMEAWRIDKVLQTELRTFIDHEGHWQVLMKPCATHSGAMALLNPSLPSQKGPMYCSQRASDTTLATP